MKPKGGDFMKQIELSHLASKVSKDILEKNRDQIAERIKSALKANEKDSKLSQSDAIAAAMVISLTLVPELSAAITARMLVELGLVDLEEAE